MLRLSRFELARPSSLDEAVAILRERADAVVIAGGTDLVPKMKRGQIEPGVVVSLDAVPGLRSVETVDGALRIGALATLRTLERDERVRRIGSMAAAAGVVATPIIRARATVGGNLLQDTRCRYYDRSPFWRAAVDHCLKKDGDGCRVASGASRCYATFCSDLAPALIVLGATVRLLGPQERCVPLETVYRDDGIDYHDLRGSILTEVTVEPDGVSSTYRKVRVRNSFDFPEVGVAVAVRDRGDTLSIRIALTGVGSRVVVRAADCAPDEVADLVDDVFKDVRPVDTMFLSPAYRKKMARRMMMRCFDELRVIR
jgi:4-hydroxybenzoyl-CoA reductase subunit beta